jgi:hypothetical protein
MTDENVSILSFEDVASLPMAFGGCTCDCHRIPGVLHVMACCYPARVCEEHSISHPDCQTCRLSVFDVIGRVYVDDNRLKLKPTE